MKKAQIINKILNKILKEYNVIVQYFFYFGNKKREAHEPLFFLALLSAYSAAIFAATAASFTALALFLRLT